MYMIDRLLYTSIVCCLYVFFDRFETPVWTLPVRIFLMKRQKWRFGVLVNLTGEKDVRISDVIAYVPPCPGDEIDIRLNASASTRSVVQIDVVRHEVSNGSYLFEVLRCLWGKKRLHTYNDFFLSRSLFEKPPFYTKNSILVAMVS